VDGSRLEAPRHDALFSPDVLYGEEVAAVEWSTRRFPAAEDEVVPRVGLTRIA